jgi:Spy/CpxP family protein refolding chaperone
MKWQTLVVLGITCVAGSANADRISHAEMRSIAVNALVNTVHLDEASAQRVQAVADRYYDSILSARIESTTTMRELSLLLRSPKPDERRVRKLSETVIAQRARLRKLQDERMHDMSKVLSSVQFGRLLTSWRAVERNIRKDARRS